MSHTAYHIINVAKGKRNVIYRKAAANNYHFDKNTQTMQREVGRPDDAIFFRQKPRNGAILKVEINPKKKI